MLGEYLGYALLLEIFMELKNFFIKSRNVSTADEDSKEYISFQSHENHMKECILSLFDLQMMVSTSRHK